jgi:NAD(P)-dependent dehydrogenase (short-subunit alcohol dehydrogenase family)
MKLIIQTSIVTIGGREIEKAIYLTLSREGADIVVTAKKEKEILENARMVKNTGMYRSLYSNKLSLSTKICKESP